MDLSNVLCGESVKQVTKLLLLMEITFSTQPSLFSYINGQE